MWALRRFRDKDFAAEIMLLGCLARGVGARRGNEQEVATRNFLMTSEWLSSRKETQRKLRIPGGKFVGACESATIRSRQLAASVGC